MTIFILLRRLNTKYMMDVYLVNVYLRFNITLVRPGKEIYNTYRACGKAVCATHGRRKNKRLCFLTEI